MLAFVISRPRASGFGSPFARVGGPSPKKIFTLVPANALVVPPLSVTFGVNDWKLRSPSIVRTFAIIRVPPLIETANVLPSCSPKWTVSVWPPNETVASTAPGVVFRRTMIVPPTLMPAVSMPALPEM